MRGKEGAPGAVAKAKSRDAQKRLGRARGRAGAHRPLRRAEARSAGVGPGHCHRQLRILYGLGSADPEAGEGATVDRLGEARPSVRRLPMVLAGVAGVVVNRAEPTDRNGVGVEQVQTHAGQVRDLCAAAATFLDVR